MSNSSLVVHTNISPNKNAPRTGKIDTITIHCTAGQCTAESLGVLFKAKSRGASSNYGVDKDGRVGMYVEEKDRSWCSSNGANDNRAVTIEVSSDNTTPYKVTDKALVATVVLCADICRRNGIKKLLWKGDKSLVGQVDKQNMTVHRWFSAKSCPGDYLYERLGYIADEVNKQLGTVAPSLVETPPNNPANPEKIIWDFLKNKGFNDFATAGIMGNLYVESGLSAVNLQNSFEKSSGFNDLGYTAAVDSGAYTNFVKDNAGYGLAQWTYYTLKQGLLDFAKKAGKSVGDLYVQLDYLWNTLQGLLTQFSKAKTVREASDIMMLQYERPADQSESARARRAQYGQGYYDKYAVKTITPPNVPLSYTVRVTADALNIRKGAGTNYVVVSSIKDKGIYTIVEEGAGIGATKWGKLKSGAGWIALDYTVRL